MADPVIPAPVRPAPPVASVQAAPECEEADGPPRPLTAIKVDLNFQLPPDYFTRTTYDLHMPLATAAALQAPSDNAQDRPQIFYKSPIRFSLSGGTNNNPGDPMVNPQVASMHQSAPKFLNIGHVQFTKFAGDVDGFAVGPVFSGVFAPDGVKLSLGAFANIPGLGSGVAAWRF